MTQFNTSTLWQRQTAPSLRFNGLLHISSLITGKSNMICPRINSYIPQTCFSCHVSNQINVSSMYSIDQAKYPEATHGFHFSSQPDIWSISLSNLVIQLKTWMPSLKMLSLTLISQPILPLFSVELFTTWHYITLYICVSLTTEYCWCPEYVQ